MKVYAGINLHSSNNYLGIINEEDQRFYQGKMAKTNSIVAIKALSNKLARASYYVMRDRMPYDSKRLFS